MFAMEHNFSYNYHATERFSFSNFTAQQRSVLRNYENALVCLGRLKNQKEFLIECLREQVVPKSLCFEVSVSESPFHPVHREVLNDRIINSRRQVDYGYWRLRRTFSTLSRFFTGRLRMTVTRCARNLAHRKNSTHRRRLINKLYRLCASSTWNKFSNTNNIVNISSTDLEYNETILLGLGLTFNTQPDKGELIPTTATIDHFITRNWSRRHQDWLGALYLLCSYRFATKPHFFQKDSTRLW